MSNTTINATGFYPFWFWNDRIDESEVRRQIQEMADKKIKGFFIHSRQGLQQPYLSKNFFDMVETAINEAEKLRLEVHLYDEYPYPSGIAGGEVVLGNPQFLATGIKHLKYELSSGRHSIRLPEGKVLNCTGFFVNNGIVDWRECLNLKEHIGCHLKNNSYDISGMHRRNYNGKRYFASDPIPVFEATTKRPMLISISIQYIVTNNKYWRYYVDVLNPAAMREFILLTHERYYARFAKKFGSVIKSIFTDETTPSWSYLIPSAFNEKYGYDLLEQLPALHLVEHPEHLNVQKDLEELKYEMFCESFEKPLSDWCEAHNIKYSGEKPTMRFSQLKFMGIPGCDPGHVKAGMKLDVLKPKIRDNARTVASAAYFFDKHASLCECYHSLGWDATIQDAKIIAEGLLLMGINYLVSHGFFYSTHALRKHDAPPSFFFQMPYWKFWRRLSDRVARISEIFEGTYIDANVLLMEPWSGGLDYEQEMCYQKIIDILISNHVEFLMGDVELLMSAKIENKSLAIKDLHIKTVIVPPRKFFSDELTAELDNIKEKVNVLFIDDSSSPAGINDIILSNVEASLAYEVIVGNPERLYMVRRSNNSATYYFLLNTSATPVEIEFKTAVTEISLDDSPLTHGNNKRYIFPFESLMLQAGNEKQTQVDIFPVVKVEIDNTFMIRMRNKNLLRLYNWNLSLDNGTTYHSVEAVPLINQLKNARIPFSPDITCHFGLEPAISIPELNLLYECQFNLEFTGSVELVMEPGTIVGEWLILVNNRPLRQDEFLDTTSHVKGSLGMDITDLLHQGENTIHVKVRTAKHDGGLLNCLYLAGFFAVELATKSLKTFMDKGRFEDYTANGLPYFSGCIEYRTLFDVKKIPEAEYVHLDFSCFNNFRDACEICVNDGGYASCLWEPRLIKVKTEILNLKNNKLTVKVHTSLIRSFEGEMKTT